VTDEFHRSGPLREGDAVQVTRGVFKGFDGTVQQIDENELKATLEIEVYGRSAPVELPVEYLARS
jgi:transcription antitermination factor NusG